MAAPNSQQFEAYVRQPMCRMIGNKRALIEFIESVVVGVRNKLGGCKIRAMDLFAGSGVVSRMLAGHTVELHSNDFETYGYIFAQCYLQRPQDPSEVHTLVKAMNEAADTAPVLGVIASNYSPADTENIVLGERAFFTRENAMRVDAARARAEEAPEWARPYLLAPLLVQCSIQANTHGIFNAFCKGKDGIGMWGGGSASTERLVRDTLVVPTPVFNPHTDCVDVRCTQEDANHLLHRLLDAGGEMPALDLIYVDSPYNQHSYGSNYGVLNILADNRMPANVSANSGIPSEWQRSKYYKKSTIAEAMRDLLEAGTHLSRYMLISFSDEGHLKANDWAALLEPYTTEVFRKEDHRSTLGVRNPTKRGKTTVVEMLYLVSRKEV
jgi:adenine-specific DNA-methyltransferase